MSARDVSRDFFCSHWASSSISLVFVTRLTVLQLLAMIKAFKIWRHYLEYCKHKVFMLIDYNKFCRFTDIKSLSFCQVLWAKKLLWYYFQINYCYVKANGTADALSRFSQRSDNEIEKLWAENSQILYQLQSSLTNASLSGLSVFFNLSPFY